MKFKKGHIYRVPIVEGSSDKLTGGYADVIVDSKKLATIIFIQKRESVGYKLNPIIHLGAIVKLSNTYSKIANSLEEYHNLYPLNIPVKEKIVEKEVVVEKEVLSRTERYHFSWIDELYNWYCKFRKLDKYV